MWYLNPAFGALGVVLYKYNDIHIPKNDEF